jgi:hypothetical protein
MQCASSCAGSAPDRVTLVTKKRTSSISRFIQPSKSFRIFRTEKSLSVSAAKTAREKVPYTSYEVLSVCVFFTISVSAATKAANFSAGITSLPTRAELSDLLSVSNWRARSSRRTTPDSMEPPSKPSAKSVGVPSRRIDVGMSEAMICGSSVFFDCFVIATPHEAISKSRKKRFRIATRNVSQNHEDSFEII